MGGATTFMGGSCSPSVSGNGRERATVAVLAQTQLKQGIAQYRDVCY